MSKKQNPRELRNADDPSRKAGRLQVALGVPSGALTASKPNRNHTKENPKTPQKTTALWSARDSAPLWIRSAYQTNNPPPDGHTLASAATGSSGRTARNPHNVPDQDTPPFREAHTIQHPTITLQKTALQAGVHAFASAATGSGGTSRPTPHNVPDQNTLPFRQAHTNQHPTITLKKTCATGRSPHFCKRGYW